MGHKQTINHRVDAMRWARLFSMVFEGFIDVHDWNIWKIYLVSLGNKLIVELLIKRSDINAPNKIGKTPLFQAASSKGESNENI